MFSFLLNGFECGCSVSEKKKKGKVKCRCFPSLDISAFQIFLFFILLFIDCLICNALAFQLAVVIAGW